ncbi:MULTISPECIES: cell division protein FtsQ/DivIB [Idiomarina]|jgi:cell division protein FtsQ|uniref:Cell division protein FtsQ n=2 Tax=Idiomarina TaxID=135575 RepID=A0A837NDZ7_9GAMM|nr:MULTISPECIES: cell division protein FtsQ/DivIB [Idiomarina]KTG28549.1 cell division protein DivIVA [Idiomarina sp. H105]MBF39385.1 cell division protein DivIVA [Idiomarinaceae bacterium]OAF08077.1 cell division protein DivIVA [Idiomarina sp. WRN-38]KPD24193.1 cell division protein DivIVA [Idiomarina zobellii]MCH2454143.1 FtsQ-type POTRA domain-containing protein [Idiomarina sp.]|tara:strand:+ start:83212 stop:83958 length:747 start_codon:yes stop_codon:yes gene_type:complete
MAAEQRLKLVNFWSGVIVFCLTLIGLGVGIYQLNEVLTDEQQVPIASLSVQGELIYTDKSEIRQALLSKPLGSFFTADVDSLRQRVEALPWVQKVSIRKVWPDRLSVFVSEHQPQALWNADRLINEQDEVFRADVTKVSAQLPQLFGPEHAVEDTLSEFYRLQKMLSVNGFSIRALRLTDRFAVSLVLEQGIEIKLGREATLERIKRFIDLFPSMMNHENSKENKVDTVDLRYDTGAAVAWREAKSES